MTEPKPDLVQVWNPRSKTYTLIDRSRGMILGHNPQQQAGVPVLRPGELRFKPQTVTYEVTALWEDGREAKASVEAHSMLGAVWQAAAGAAAAGMDGEPVSVRAEVRHG